LGIVLVTGGAGFIGSNVARGFCDAGRRVVVSDRMRDGGKWRNLQGVGLHDLIVPDALPDWLERNRGDVDLVVHLGAVSSTTERDVDRITRENIRLSIDLWSWCTQTATPFIYASSAATYGDGGAGFDDDERPEALAALQPLNAYGWSKHMIDQRFVADVTEGCPVPPQWVGLKFFNVYGSGEDHKGDMRSVVNKIMPIVRAGQPVKLFRSYRADYPDGGQQRDFVYVADIVAAIMWLASRRSESGIFNIGSGQARTWNDLAHAVFTELGRPPMIEYIDMPEHIRGQYQYFTQAPIDKLRRAGWNHTPTPLEEGVRHYVAAWTARNPASSS
jgi:ADP-L-glycero-D-manno-heptose 6-epimerase